MLNAPLVEPVRADPEPRELAPMLMDLRSHLTEAAKRATVERTTRKGKSGYQLELAHAAPPAETQEELKALYPEIHGFFSAKRKSAASQLAVSSKLAETKIEHKAAEDLAACVAANLLPMEFSDLQKGCSYLRALACVNLEPQALKQALKSGSAVRTRLQEASGIISPAVLSHGSLMEWYNKQTRKAELDKVTNAWRERQDNINRDLTGAVQRLDGQQGKQAAQHKALEENTQKSIIGVHAELAKLRTENGKLREDVDRKRSRSRSPRAGAPCGFSPYFVPSSPFAASPYSPYVAPSAASTPVLMPCVPGPFGFGGV